eukprot:Hpha_TRINITY_DN15482_c3_g1::TRINITY_DN15482_c3_g1_i1::g.172690::m.172690
MPVDWDWESSSEVSELDENYAEWLYGDFIASRGDVHDKQGPMMGVAGPLGVPGSASVAPVPRGRGGAVPVLCAQQAVPSATVAVGRGRGVAVAPPGVRIGGGRGGLDLRAMAAKEVPPHPELGGAQKTTLEGAEVPPQKRQRTEEPLPPPAAPEEPIDGHLC